MVYEVAEPSPTFALYLETTTALSIATVLVNTEIHYLHRQQDQLLD